MAQFLTPADVQVFEPDVSETKAAAMIENATAQAVMIAPCLKASTDEDVRAAAKSILLIAVLRWNESGSGALQMSSTTTGPFTHQETYDTRQRWSGLFRPDEIDRLQGLCASGGRRRAFTIDTTPRWEVEA